MLFSLLPEENPGDLQELVGVGPRDWYADEVTYIWCTLSSGQPQADVSQAHRFITFLTYKPPPRALAPSPASSSQVSLVPHRCLSFLTGVSRSRRPVVPCLQPQSAISPSLISLMLSVDVKHRVYLLPRWSVSTSLQSNGRNLPHLIARDILRHQRTLAVTYLEGYGLFLKPTGRSLSCYALAREASLAATLHKIITDSSSQSANRFAEQKEDIHNLRLQEWSTWVSGTACLRRNVLSWALNSDTVGRFRGPAGSEFQTDGARKPVKLKALTTRF